MSVVARNFERRTEQNQMSTLQIPVRKIHRGSAEIVVAHIAIAMLRWSSRRRLVPAVAAGPTHDDIRFRHDYELKRAQAPFSSSLLR
jgi:hypothetical protein